MTVTESYYRLVARRSAGIQSVADLKGKRVMVPRMTSAHYFLVAMLRSAGLTEEDVVLVNLPRAQGDQTGMDQMSDALARGRGRCHLHLGAGARGRGASAGDDAVVLQDRSVYREVFNLHARATDLADPEKRRSIVAFVRAVAEATEALKTDPETVVAACVGRYRLQRRGDRLGLAGDGVPGEDRAGHAGRARSGRGLGRQGRQSGSTKSRGTGEVHRCVRTRRGAFDQVERAGGEKR